ncbi:MAG: tyrosine-type recombinase/integrase [Methanophagales archaeon]|nr:tyrosine-type recombinase/integrase [Methanophagales archaeon]
MQTDTLTVTFFSATISNPTTALHIYMQRDVRPKTAAIYNERLRPFLSQFATLQEITPAHINAWYASLSHLAPTSRASYAQTLKAFFNWCQADGRIQLSQNPAHHLKTKRARSARNKAANETDILKLLSYLEGKLLEERTAVTAIRDLLLVRLFYESGNRLTEIATLTLTAMATALRNGRINQRGILIHTAYSDDGKRGSVPVRFSEYTAAAYRQWTENRPPGGTRVFVSVRETTAVPLHKQSITNILTRRCRQASLPPIRPHAIRHLKGTTVCDAYGPAAAAAMLNISFDVAQQHYYDATETAVLNATLL